MEKQSHEEYRDELAGKLKEIRNSDSHEAARDHLENEKQTSEYIEAKVLHLEDVEKIIIPAKEKKQLTQEELIEALWDQLEPDIDEINKKEEEKRLADPLRGGVGSGPKVPFLDNIITQPFIETKKELGDQILLKLSEPTRFEILYKKTYLKHSEEYKRAHAHEYQEVLDPFIASDILPIGFVYDMEDDILKTRKHEEKELSEKLKFEMLFLDAFDENRLEEATVFLSAIEIARKDAKEGLKTETLNWRFNLSLKLYDVDMFKKSVKGIIEESERFEDLRGVIAKGAERLIGHHLLDRVELKLSKLGQSKVRELGQEQAGMFFTGQVKQFIEDSYLIIADKLISDSNIDLLNEAKTILSQRRQSYLLGENFLIDDLIFIQKKN